MHLFHSLKMKLIVICTSVSLILALLLSILVNETMTSNLKREQMQTIQYNLQQISSSIERELTALYQLVVFCTTNRDLTRFTSGSGRSSYSSYPISMTAYDALNAKVFNSSIDQYVRKIILCSRTEESIVQGNISGMLQDKDVCRALPYFNDLLESPDYKWIGLQKEPFYYSGSNAWSLPVIRPLINRGTGAIDGWIYIAVDDAIIRDKLTQGKYPFDSSYYWLIGEKTYRLEQNAFREVSIVMEMQPDPSLFRITETPEAPPIDAISVTLDNAPWTILQTVPENQSLFHGKYLEILLPYFIVVILLFLCMDYLLIRIVSAPITRIQKQLNAISQGSFSPNPSLESADEFGEIGRGINDMTQSISQLMQQQLANEREKRQLEIINLQNQISPHFLYNTLYTIKWMAIMQNAHGIAEMLDSVSQIMKYVSKNTDSKIPLRDELTLLGHYITIQRYRYGDSFTYTQEIDSEALLDCKVFKFSLQPLIENAITHGIGGKKQPGQIRLHVSKCNEDLLIYITDDGIGISPQQIDQILSSSEDITEEALFKKIGLKNIDRRLKIEYGPHYGIQICSKLGSYTEVTVRYPFVC